MQEKTCFNLCKETKKSCTNVSCRYNIANNEKQNCALLAIDIDGMTLGDIADILNLSRMRIFQIEKNAIAKIKVII